MNCKNANKELGFDVFSECDYNLHWSFSNFNRMLMVAGQIAQLPFAARVLELGAGTSDLEHIVRNNFKRDDLFFYKVDGDAIYEDNTQEKTIVKVEDITSEIFFERMCKHIEVFGGFDAVVFMEVIEHIEKEKAEVMLEKISKLTKYEGLLLFTTPTPPFDKFYEERVWPLDHAYEFSQSDIEKLINKKYKINKQIGWSLEEREYTQLLETNNDIMKVFTKLRGAMPESFIKAIIACLAPVEYNRQILMVCKKRRDANG